MNYVLENGKNIRIPDAEIENNMRLLEISREEAIQMWLEDNDFQTNDVVEELTKKAKVNKINREAKADAPRKKVVRERKPDAEKEKLIEMLAIFLTNAGYPAEITNKSKIIEFNVGENHYKLDLIRQRAKKTKEN